MTHSKFEDVNKKRVKEVIDMLILTTKKTELDEEEIAKEAEKHDLTFEEVQETMNHLVKENFVEDTGHRVYKKK